MESAPSSEIQDSSYTTEEPDEDKYTVAQRYQMATVYDFLAKLLPTEGKDYAVRFIFSDNNQGRMSVKLEPYTKLGKLWCDYCSEMLSRTPQSIKSKL